jgi:deoxyribodipyrimidine photo-lyase
VFWTQRYEARGRAQDDRVAKRLRSQACEVTATGGTLLVEPAEITTKTGGPFRVYSPFWRAVLAGEEPAAVLPAPRNIEPATLSAGAPKPVRLDALGLLPTKPDWAGGLRETWTPGEAGARQRLRAFLESGLVGYADERDRPDRETTSRLSPHLAAGEISPRQIWHGAQHALAEGRAKRRDIDKFLSEVGWREFSYHLLFHFPDLATKNFNPAFDAFPWASPGKTHLKAWQRGQTGYPIVDAGMRQLWQTGWMHNRVRLIVGSFLAKHLLIDWRKGEDWFWDTLCDADPANNAASWQWIAGSGADAAPYFRIFNPVLQGEKFDAEGEYVKQFVPELRKVPAKYVHRPWMAPAEVLDDAGVRLGKTYPTPIVDHGEARAAAMAAFGRIKAA